MTYFFRWFTFVVSIIAVLLGIEYFFSALSFLWETDQTYLSWVILCLFVISNMWIGKKFKKIDQELYMYEHETQKVWWAAESCMALGMIGTLVGLLTVLMSAFAEVDVTSVNEVKEILAIMTAGMGTALITSLVGLVFSLVLKYEIVSLETANNETS